MDKTIWMKFHFVMVIVLSMISMFSEKSSDKKENNSLKSLRGDKKRSSISEIILTLIIVIAVAIGCFCLATYFIVKNQVFTRWLIGIFGVLYIYLAIRLMIKIIFVPENSDFSGSDIKDFVYVYLVWWLMMALILSKQLQGNMFGKKYSGYEEIVKIGIILFQYYFNIFFTLGGIYIFFFYVLRFVTKLVDKFNLNKIENIKYRIRDLLELSTKCEKMKCFGLWENNRKKIIYKIVITIPALIFDILQVVYIFIEAIFKMGLVFIMLVWELLSVLYKYFKKLWSKYQNNEWLYIFAQIAGLCSYAITFITVQYGDYEEATKNIYEFIGTIILIPYFLAKIVGVRKALKENVPQIIHKEKKYSNTNNMTYNEDAEEIDGKTIRQSECETVQGMEKNFHRVNIIDNRKIEKDFRRTIRNNRWTKIKIFLENNIEIVVGICISVLMVGIYFVFKSPQNDKNISLIGSIIGAEGTMVAVLLTIAFTKKSNERALDATVLPYLTIEKDNKPSENAYAFEYFKTTIDKRDFSVWRKFNFDMICKDKEKLTRNGIAYLRIKNVGIGPAIHLNMEIKNFSNVYLPIDYLRPNEDLRLILNFNNPDDSYQTDIIFEYETIRGNRHSQRFQANITRHLDRTNFTLFG